MSKVSYEEAKKAFREICSGYEEPNSREIVGNFIAQHDLQHLMKLSRLEESVDK